MNGSAVLWWTITPFLVNGLVLLTVVVIWRWRLTRRAERVPIAEKLLRPAGESLRRRVDALEDKLLDRLLISVALPTLAGFAVILLPLNGFVLVRFFAALLLWLALLIFGGWWILALLRELRQCHLGFHGERAVGEELNQLLRDGCRVFHDVPMEPYGNIDHVIVAPSGVYAVETKTKRKRKAPPGKKEYEVVFNGKALEFPHGTDTMGLEQARQQADRLRVYLSKAVGEAVGTVPILTLPGWYVTSRVNGSIKVLNPKGIRPVVLNGQARNLTPQLVERISHQLDQKCRDVEL